MRKKYIQPIACSIEIGEEELICLSKFSLDDYSGEYNGQWYYEGHLCSSEEEYKYFEKNGYIPGAKATMIWEDIEVDDW